MKYCQTLTGALQLEISDDPGCFEEVARQIIKITGAEIKEKLDGFDQAYWDILIGGEIYTIHKEHYLGVMIYSDSARAKEVFEEIRRRVRV